MVSGGTQLGQTLRVGGRKSISVAADFFPIPRLLVVSARNASKMRKSPQSKKPLHNVFSAPPLCLAGAAWAEHCEVNLAALRDVRKMPTMRRSYARGAGHMMRFFSSALIVTEMTRGTGSRLS